MGPELGRQTAEVIYLWQFFCLITAREKAVKKLILIVKIYTIFSNYMNFVQIKISQTGGAHR